MKIGIVSEYYYPTIGGIQEHVHHFALEARRAGHEVLVLTPAVHDHLASRRSPAANRRADEQNGVIRVGHSVPLLSRGSIARFSVGGFLGVRLREILRAERFDVLHFHSPLMPTLPLLALPLADCATVGTFHSAVDGSALLRLFQPLLQRRLDRLGAAVGVSPVALRGLAGRFRGRFRVIPNGVDVVGFAAGRRRPEFSDGRRTVLHVGRFDPRNGVDRVIKSFVLLRQAGLDARLVLVGDGPLRRHYQRLVPASLRPDVHFVGFVPGEERPSYYASADVLLCPAVGGTFGIILVEAMAAGLAVVAADTPGFRTVMRPGVEGLMVPLTGRRAEPELAGACAALLLDRQARRRCGEEGRRTAAAYGWPLVGARVLSLYQELLDGRAATAEPSSEQERAA